MTRPTDSRFGPEPLLLEAICLETFEGGKFDLLREYVSSPGMDWEKFVGLAIRHKLAPLVSFTLDRLGLLDRAFIPSWDIYYYLYDALNLNRYKLSLVRVELDAVVQALKARNVTFVARKGLLLDWQFYQSEGLRIISDVDFMIEPTSAKVVTEAMHALGYRHGMFSERRNAIEPLPREELITFRLNPDHLPPLLKAIDDPLVKVFEVDIATSFTWTRSEFNVPVSEALASRVEYQLPRMSTTLPSFSPVWQFLDTALHCFREAYTERAILDDNDVALRKFLDILLLWKTHREALLSGEFHRLIDSHGLTFPMAWVLTYTDIVFGTDLLEKLGLKDSVTREQLSIWRASGGQSRSWSGDMRERLYARDRKELLLGKADS